MNRCLHCVLKVDSFYGWRHPARGLSVGAVIWRDGLLFSGNGLYRRFSNAGEVDGNYENLRSPGVLTPVGDGTSPIGLAGSTGCKRVEVQGRYQTGGTDSG